MYGKWVTVDMGNDFEVKVFVYCLPETSKEELQKMAKHKLKMQMINL